MTVRAYVLIQGEVGKAREIQRGLRQLQGNPNGSRITSESSVTGPYDFIVHVESEDLDTLGNFITDFLQKLPAVKDTTSCLEFNI